jgi:GNAT superfamily N-acetyltransferase
MGIEVRPVKTRKDQKAFLRFPFQHYVGDPHWVPSLLLSDSELLNFKAHPFYEKSEIQPFLAYRDGQPVGRIAAIVDAYHNEYHKENRGMFGFFECVDDSAVAKELFDAAKAWFAGKGISHLRGPANPSQNHTWGLLVDGFDSKPKFMMTYNKPYYERLVLENGFVKSQDLFAFMGHVDMLETLDPKLQFVVEEAKRRFKVKVRPIDKKNFDTDVGHFLNIYNQAVAGQWGFTPMTNSEMRETAKGLKLLLAPELTTIAEIDGEPVGAVVGLLDYNPLIKKIGGKLLPFGALRLLWGKRKIRDVRVLSTNVVPQYQRWGLGLVLLERLVPNIKKWGIENVEFSWVLESNKLSRGTLERGGAKLEKTYRIYDFDPS